MSIFLEITQLENGDIVLREADDSEEHADVSPERESRTDQPQPAVPLVGISAFKEPLVRIRFSNEVKTMLGDELVGVAEAMIEAATDFLGTEEMEGSDPEIEPGPSTPVIH
jgi:hypothetical protein